MEFYTKPKLNMSAKIKCTVDLDLDTNKVIQEFIYLYNGFYPNEKLKKSEALKFVISLGLPDLKSELSKLKNQRNGQININSK